jgi:beta-lactamase regulating signal transducer with metallopeptidase domain
MIAWALEALVASTILMVAVLLLRGPARRAFGPDIAYALWLLPALRLLLPPLPQELREAAVVPVLHASEQITILLVEPLGEAAAAPVAQFSLLGPALVMLWVAGAAAFIAWHAFAHVRFCRRMLAETARATRIEDGVQVIETGAATGPLAFGIWRRYVAFPRDFAERYDADERDLALAHELGHHARGDLIANWAALVVLALHWFNPIAWRAFRAFRADQEIANDARVLAGQNPMLRHVYACAIVKAAHGGAVSAACHLHTIDDLKGRLRMLTTRRTSRARLVAGVGTVAVLTAAGLGVTASGTRAAERVRSGVENATGIQLAELDRAAIGRISPLVSPAPVPAPAAAVAPVAAVQSVGALPEAPPVPRVQPAPPAPPVPPAPPALAIDEDSRNVTVTMSPDGKTVRKQIRVISRDKDGKLKAEDFPAAAEMAKIPEIRSMNCADDGKTHQMVLNEDKGGKRKIIICSNRIERVASEGAAIAANGADIERNAYHSALRGLQSARAGIATNMSMAEEARKEALQGIDQAIKEVEEDMAKAQ